MSKETVQCEQLAKGIANAAERITESFAAALANIGAFNPATYALLKEPIKFQIASIFVEEIEKATAATQGEKATPPQPEATTSADLSDTVENEFADCR